MFTAGPHSQRNPRPRTASQQDHPFCVDRASQSSPVCLNPLPNLPAAPHEKLHDQKTETPRVSVTTPGRQSCNAGHKARSQTQPTQGQKTQGKADARSNTTYHAEHAQTCPSVLQPMLTLCKTTRETNTAYSSGH